MQSLENEVTNRFENFKKTEPNFNCLIHPIVATMDTAAKKLRLELIDRLPVHNVKEMFNVMTLIDFYKSLSHEKCPCV
ncbi:hypothetical protein TNCV_2103181 [Trichonephila clavipes]|nr:hypothetical protein TNCV_2103181 [Trichonephila clavipes]